MKQFKVNKKASIEVYKKANKSLIKTPSLNIQTQLTIQL